MPDPPPGHPWWHRLPLRLSLRASMTLVLALAGGLAWFVNSARVQHDAAVAIQRAGGTVRYEWEVTASPEATKEKTGLFTPNPGGRPWGPRWLARLLGPDYLGHIKVVHLGPRDPDAVMAHVARLRRVEQLAVGNTPLTDAGMVHLRPLTRLRGLFLFGKLGVTGEGLKNLVGLHRLEHLQLADFPAAGADLSPLRGLTRLRLLFVRDPATSDAGMVQLKGLVDLRKLMIVEGQVTPEGLKSLRGLTRLSRLTFHEPGLTDLEPFRHLTGLRYLDVGGPVDDAGLNLLEPPPGLVRLELRGTRVTDAGVAQMERAHPKLSVSRSP